MPYQDQEVGMSSAASAGANAAAQGHNDGGPRRGRKKTASSPKPKLRPKARPEEKKKIPNTNAYYGTYNNHDDGPSTGGYTYSGNQTYSAPPPKKYNLTLGYDAIPIFRPKFIYFEFTGLRPNTPHWIFFGKQVNKWVNTDKTEDDLINAGVNSKLKEPGDSYKSATSFPTAQGGASNGGGDDPLTTTAEGKLSGIFFLQSNDDLSFPIPAAGIDMIATDIEAINLDKCKSFAGATFRGYGQYENYFRGTSSQIAQAKAIQETLKQNSTPSEEIV